MEKSLFPKWVDSLFAVFAKKVTEKLNGGKTPLTYLHRKMLIKEYSPTLKWGSLSVNNNVVSADIVAMDSSLPLKRRDSLSKADGDIPKIGMALSLNETTMNELNILVNTKAPDSEVIKKLFRDTDKVIAGVWERLEYMFLEALSTGVTIVATEDNPGLGIRIDFGHPDSNKFGVIRSWAENTATPIDDINNILAVSRARGTTLRYLMMDLSTWNLFKKNTQVKQEFAFHAGFTGDNVPNVSNVDKANEFLKSSYKVEIQIVDRMVMVEKDGKRKAINPWAENTVVFLEDMNVGTLTYGKLAEETFPAKQVDYAKTDDFILVSKFHTNNPIKEFTSSQALVLPVINNVDGIYFMNTEDAVTDAQTEGDANFAYKTVNYTRTSVIAAINLAAGKTIAKTNNTDAKLLEYVNALSDEQVLIFEGNITPSV